MICLAAVANLSYQLSLQPALEAGKWAGKENPKVLGQDWQVEQKQNTSLKFSKVFAPWLASLNLIC
jgi:hypothetical protein